MTLKLCQWKLHYAPVDENMRKMFLIAMAQNQHRNATQFRSDKWALIRMCMSDSSTTLRNISQPLASKYMTVVEFYVVHKRR